MKNLTWQNPEQLFVAQELINKVKSKCCGIKGDENELKGKTDLKLFLRHTSTEEKAKETYRAFSYRVFDIRSAIEAYKNANEGRYPSNITIVSEANSSNNDVPKTTTTTPVTYTFRE